MELAVAVVALALLVLIHHHNQLAEMAAQEQFLLFLAHP
jgi:hypothetical protein